MKTLHLGPEEILVAAKIGVSAASATEVAETIDRAEVAIREAEPMVTALYLEPDIYQEGHVPRRPPRAARAAPATDLDSLRAFHRYRRTSGPRRTCASAIRCPTWFSDPLRDDGSSSCPECGERRRGCIA